MKRLLRSNTYWLSLVLLAWLVQPAQGQAPRELKTKPGVAVAMVNLVNPRPDCSGDPGRSRCRVSGGSRRTATS